MGLFRLSIGIAALFSVFFIFQLVGPSTPSSLKVHRSALRHVVKTTDPLLATDASSLIVVNHTHDGLLEWVPTHGLRPALALKWQAASDFKTFHFFLRPKVLFQDQHPFTAHDVKNSLQRLARHPGTYTAYYSALKFIDVIDDHTVRIRLARSMPDLPLLLASSQAKISRSENGIFIGTGPFRFRSANNTMVLEPFTDYWGEKPKIGKLEFQVLTAPEARALAEGALVDDLNSFASYFPPAASDRSGWKEQSYWSTWVWIMGDKAGPFANPRCRAEASQALETNEFPQASEPNFFPKEGPIAKTCTGVIDIAVSQDLIEGGLNTSLTHALDERLQVVFPNAVLNITRLEPEKLRADALLSKHSAYLTALTTPIADPSFLSDALSELVLPGLKLNSSIKLKHLTESLVRADSAARRLFAANEMATFLKSQQFTVSLPHAVARNWQRDCVKNIKSSPLSVGHTLYREVENECPATRALNASLGF